MRHWLFLIFLTLAACRQAPTNGQDTALAANADTGTPVVITTARGPVGLSAEMAITPEEQTKGLMFRKSLPAGQGMLFPFMPPKLASFWMKDTVIPLDLIFVAPDGKVSAVFADREPYSLQPIATGQPTVAVLELAGGEAARLGIAAGGTLRWGACPYPPGAGPEPKRFCP